LAHTSEFDEIVARGAAEHQSKIGLMAADHFSDAARPTVVTVIEMPG
jgi:hypothetical protein